MHIHLLFHSQGSNDGKFIQLIAAPTAGQTYERYGYVFTLDVKYIHLNEIICHEFLKASVPLSSALPDWKVYDGIISEIAVVIFGTLHTQK